MLKSKASDIPGDSARVLTASAVDITGKIWAKGTVYQPLSNGTIGQIVMIQGRKVIFAARASEVGS